MTANDAKLYLTDLWESDWTSVDETIALEMAINALTAIEDIKAEISEYKDDKIIHLERNEMVDNALAIIDRHISGKET